MSHLSSCEHLCDARHTTCSPYLRHTVLPYLDSYTSSVFSLFFFSCFQDTVAVGWCAGVARRGARSTWAGGLWRFTGFDASVGAGSMTSSAAREAFSLLATGTSAMGAAAALEALASEVTAILIVVVWVCLALRVACRSRAGYFPLSFSAFVNLGGNL